MVTAGRLVKAMGGKRVFREPARSYEAVIKRVRAGLPYAALEAVAARFEISQDKIVRLLALPPRTLARRKKEGRLRADESDRLLRVSRIGALAEETLGNRERAATWLSRANRALGGAIPLELLDSDLGAIQVEQILGRISHGVYS